MMFFCYISNTKIKIMKTNYLVLLLLLFASHPKIHSQNYIPYYNLVNEAEVCVFLGKKDLAFGLYNKAFSIKGISPKAKDLYFMGKLYLEQKEKEKATAYFKKIFPLPDGQFSLWANKQKTYFLDYYQENEFRALVSEAEDKENEYFLKVKFIHDSLARFLYEDQRLRKIFVDSVQPRYKEGDKIYDLFAERIDSNDYENQSRFLSFIKKYGYPGTYLIGHDGAATILMHIHCKLFVEYRETLYSLLFKGKMEPFYYAEMVNERSPKCGNFFGVVYNGSLACETCPQYLAEQRASIGLSNYFKDSGTRPYVERQLLIGFE
jgi:tetratricopeptide (TPR) repeat protein